MKSRDGKSQRREEKKKEYQKRESLRGNPGARKGRKVAKHCVLPMICGSGGSKSRLAKAAGAEPAGQMRDEKVHAVVERSTFPSQNVQSTPCCTCLQTFNNPLTHERKTVPLENWPEVGFLTQAPCAVTRLRGCCELRDFDCCFFTAVAGRRSKSCPPQMSSKGSSAPAEGAPTAASHSSSENQRGRSRSGGFGAEPRVGLSALLEAVL